MATLNPYLNFNGNAEDAFNHYKSVFGNEFNNLQRYKDMPFDSPEKEDGNRILHISLPIGKDSFLLGSDCPSSYPPAKFGDNCWISVNANSEAHAKSIFNGLSEGGKINMPLEKTFWADLFGMCVDKFGVGWMINFDAKTV